MVTFLAFDFAAQLSLEQVCYYGVVPRGEVLTPLLTLLIYRQLVAVDLFVLWLLFDSVQLVVHAVEEEAQELLGVLLAVAAELPCHSAYLLFQLIWSDGATSAHPCAFEERVVRVCQASSSKGLLRGIVGQEVFCQGRSGEDALENGIHETRVADVVQPCGAIAVALRWNLRDRLLRHRKVVEARTAPEPTIISRLRRLQRGDEFCARRLRRFLFFKSLPYSCAFRVLNLAVAFPEQCCVISGLLQLVLVGLLELSGVAIVVTKRILLKVLRPD